MSNSKITITSFKDVYSQEWDKFVENSNDGTIFHKIQFLKYHDKGNFNFHHLIFKKNNEILSVLPGGIENGVFKSPVGASFGSFVTLNVSLEDADKLVKCLVEHCKNESVKEISVTLPPIVYQKTINCNIEYSMIYNEFKYSKCLHSSVVDLESSKGRILNLFTKRARNDLNKAKRRGVEIKESDNLDEFYPILLENKQKFGTKPTHTLEELKRIEKLLPGSIKLLMAYTDKKPIAGILSFIANSKTMLNFYTASYSEYNNYSPVTSLLYELLDWTLKNNFRYFDYGISPDTKNPNPMEPSWDLIFFKESIGASGCLRNTLSLSLK